MLIKTQKEELMEKGVMTLRLRVEYFTMESDGLEITRIGEEYKLIEYFEGEKNVLSLEVYPCEYWDTRDGGARRHEYEIAGRSHLELLRAGCIYMNYSGYVHSPRRVRVSSDWVGFNTTRTNRT